MSALPKSSAESSVGTEAEDDDGTHLARPLHTVLYGRRHVVRDYWNCESLFVNCVFVLCVPAALRVGAD